MNEKGYTVTQNRNSHTELKNEKGTVTLSQEMKKDAWHLGYNIQSSR